MQKNYPRVKRDYSVEQIEDENNNMWKLSKTIEEEGFFFAGEIDIGPILHLRPFNNHVYYKSLKQVYGMPDPVIFEGDIADSIVAEMGTDYGIELPEISGTQIPEDYYIRIQVWSYFIKLGSGGYIEITCAKDDFDPPFKLWFNPQELGKGDSNFAREVAWPFVSSYLQLLNIVDNNYDIKKEQQILTERHNGLLKNETTNNLYSDYLKSADGIIEIAEELANTEEEAAKGLLHFVPGGKLKKIKWNTRTLLISATVFYMMAIEAFINLLYQNLLKPEFEYDQFRRSIKANGPELNILTLPVYCEGFAKNITPEDDAIKNWTNIRHLRNNLIHANLTEENKILFAEEDGITFFYHKYLHHKYGENYHTSTMFFTKDDAIRVKKNVQKIVADIIDKMDEDAEEWINFWIDSDFILPYKNF